MDIITRLINELPLENVEFRDYRIDDQTAVFTAYDTSVNQCCQVFVCGGRVDALYDGSAEPQTLIFMAELPRTENVPVDDLDINAYHVVRNLYNSYRDVQVHYRNTCLSFNEWYQAVRNAISAYTKEVFPSHDNFLVFAKGWKLFFGVDYDQKRYNYQVRPVHDVEHQLSVKFAYVDTRLLEMKGVQV